MRYLRWGAGSSASSSCSAVLAHALWTRSAPTVTTSPVLRVDRVHPRVSSTPSPRGRSPPSLLGAAAGRHPDRRRVRTPGLPAVRAVTWPSSMTHPRRRRCGLRSWSRCSLAAAIADLFAVAAARRIRTAAVLPRSLTPDAAPHGESPPPYWCHTRGANIRVSGTQTRGLPMGSWTARSRSSPVRDPGWRRRR